MSEIKLTESEWKLIEFVRKLGDGKLTLMVRNGQPSKIQKPIQDIVL